MRDLNYDLKQLCQRNRDGSYSTQNTRERCLTQIADQLHELGFRKMRATSLKPKHIEALVKHWQEQELKEGTIKNRMSYVRWWAEKVGKQSVVESDNSAYGIAERQVVTNISKSRELHQEQLDKIYDPHLKISLQLQKAFGLRREESMKIVPHLADREQELYLKGSWTKGGRERLVPIRTQEQRDLLEEAKSIAGRGSMIPSNRKYIDQLRLYQAQTSRAGMSKLHGLRHLYAQERYLEMTGRECPARGGKTQKELTKPERLQDYNVRREISKELGHSRVQITTVYLGR